MNLVLYYHPLSSFCQKVLTALDEMEIPFEGVVVNLGNEESSAKLRAIWPLAKFPVLSDLDAHRDIPESSIIIEYLNPHASLARQLIPESPDIALDVRLWDRFFDLHVQVPMQKIVGDRLRAEASADAFGVNEARAALHKAYLILEERLQRNTWAVGDRFTMADVAASPALFYSSIVEPFPSDAKELSRYFEQLMARPAYERALEGARPYFQWFPYADNVPARFR